MIRVKFYGGPRDGDYLDFQDNPPPEWLIPVPPSLDTSIHEGALIPSVTIRTRAEVYRLVSDPWRGPAYCYAGRRDA